MGSVADYIAIAISIVSLVGALYSITYTRKTFIFSVCTERAKEVKFIWNSFKKTTSMTTVKDQDWLLWSATVSEIVASFVIIDKMADRYKLFRFLYDVKNFYIIFWQLIPTDLRSAIEGYEQTLHESLDNEQATFKKQMKTILKTYQR